MFTQKIAINQIGSCALQNISHNQSGSLLGTTSAGIFAQLEQGQILFITDNPYRGPINLVTEKPLDAPDIFKAGMQFSVSGHALEVRDAGCIFQFSNARVWRTPKLSINSDIKLDANQRLIMKQIAQGLLEIKNGDGFSTYLPCLAENQRVQNLRSDDSRGGLNDILNVQTTGQRGDFQQFIQNAIALLGYGRGLTPSGDDFCLGLLFMLNRYQPLLKSSDWIGAFNREMILQAWKKTTAISASLLECAVQAQIEERIFIAIDGLMLNKLTSDEIIRLLAGWGNSSGADVLAGVFVFINTFLPTISE